MSIGLKKNKHIRTQTKNCDNVRINSLTSVLLESAIGKSVERATKHGQLRATEVFARLVDFIL